MFPFDDVIMHDIRIHYRCVKGGGYFDSELWLIRGKTRSEKNRDETISKYMITIYSCIKQSIVKTNLALAMRRITLEYVFI